MAMSCLAELDCLIALSSYSTNASDVMCLPEFIDLNSSTKVCLISSSITYDICPLFVKCLKLLSCSVKIIVNHC